MAGARWSPESFCRQVKIFVDNRSNKPQYLLPELLEVAVMGSNGPPEPKLIFKGEDNMATKKAKKAPKKKK